MAKSKYEYVRDFELLDRLLPQTFIVIRLDGQGFHKFTKRHGFSKPNDDRGLGLMNRAALEIMREIPDIALAYGQSDEYSFVFKRDTELHNRRSSKLVSSITSRFSSNYVYYWKEYFPEQELMGPPSFDGRAICYPSIEVLRDYLSWRQVDCHINNLYNLCFWKLVQSGSTNQEAQEALKGTVSSDKNELLFTKFQINYSLTPEMHRKGSVIFKPKIPKNSSKQNEDLPKETDEDSVAAPPTKLRWGTLGIQHIDIIQKQFWLDHPYILESSRRH